MPNIFDKIPPEIISPHQDLTNADKRWFNKYEKIYRRGVKDSLTLSCLLTGIAVTAAVIGIVLLIVWLVTK
jgi:hypothetical protein